MKRILVTGATGFIGSHLVEELVKQGVSLRVTYPPGDNFQRMDSLFLIDGLDLESRPLDLLNRNQIEETLQGCHTLFHTESFCSFHRRDRQKNFSINHLGTKNLMEVALRVGVEKIVYTSGIETLGSTHDKEVANERDGLLLEEIHSDFEKSRWMAEREILQLRHQGLPVVIVHPTVCVGTREQLTTPFGRFLYRYLQGKVHFYLDTGLNMVSIQDVVKGHILAAKRGKTGSRYILGGSNLYLLQILQKLEAITHIPAPRIALPNFLAKVGNYFRMPSLRLPRAAFERLQRPLFFDSKLAHHELGMPESDVWKALEAQIREYQNTLP